MSAYATALKESSRETLLKEALRQHDRAAKVEKSLIKAKAVIKRCEADVNWMLNNDKLLSPRTFEYLYDAVKEDE